LEVSVDAVNLLDRYTYHWTDATAQRNYEPAYRPHHRLWRALQAVTETRRRKGMQLDRRTLLVAGAAAGAMPAQALALNAPGPGLPAGGRGFLPALVSGFGSA
jgi:hypothetical protein